MVPFRTAVRAWFGISLQTFGGPAGQIAVMQRALVDDRRWISQRRFLHALNYCMLLPGPEAHQLAIYVGWLLNGLRGGLAAGVLFVLPGLVALLALSALYVGFGDTTVVAALFTGLGAAVVAIVAQAVVRVAGARADPPAAGRARGRRVPRARRVRRAVPDRHRRRRARRLAGRPAHPRPDPQRRARHGRDEGPPPLIADDALHHRGALHRADAAHPRRRAGRCGPRRSAWSRCSPAPASVFTTQGLFFAGTALVTFGGAYAVLAFVAQQAVQTYGWLSSGRHGPRPRRSPRPPPAR